VSLDPQLLEILACPDTHHAPLIYDDPAQTLTCTECGRIFEIRDGIPVLLLDEAREGRAAPGAARAGGADSRAQTAGAAPDEAGVEEQ
jgi:uncharacterized protein YbaR (Trm112 family)